jgi:hypothetical protein
MKLKRLLVGLPLLLVIAAVGGVLLVDSLARQAVERGGQYALGVPTRLDEASIGLFSGRFTLSGLAVANPPGFAAPSFFELRSTELELPLSALLSDRVTIPALELEGIVLSLERNGTGTNYGVILDHLQRFESGEAPAAGEEPPGEPGKTFVLSRLVIRDVHTSIDLLPEGGELTRLSLAIPEIVVEDLGTDMSLAEVCALVVKTVIRAAVQQGGGQLPEELLRDLEGRLGALEDVARAQIEDRIQQAAEELGPEAGKALQEAGNKLGEKLDGLLKKKN